MIYIRKFKILFLLALILSSVGISTIKVFAINTDYARQDIYFSGTDGNTCTSSTSTYSGTTSVANIVDNDTLKAIFTQLISNQANPINAVQAAAIMGNMYGESGFNPTASEEPAGPGYGLAQWSSAGRKANLNAYAAAQGKPVSDVSVQVGFLLQEYNTKYISILKGTAFENATDISKATNAWMIGFEAPLVQTGTDPSALNSKRIPAAVKVYGFYSSLAPSSSGVAQSNCGSTDGVVQGKIVQTAINFALPIPQAEQTYTESNATGKESGQSDAKSTYQSAKTQYDPTPPWSDCGAFIATVMISTGVDVSYPKVNVATQYAYVIANTTKYTILKNPSVTDLQPGDILISVLAGHTVMYTGDTTYPDVDASLGTRVPSVRTSATHVYMLGFSDVIAARVKS